MRKTYVYLSEEAKQNLRNEYLTTDLKIDDLATKYNVNRTTIYGILKKVPKRKKIFKKYNRPTAEQKRQIIDDYQNTDMGLKELQEKYNVVERTILRALKNIPKKGPILTKINVDYFKIIDTPSKAYFLGFIAADGHIAVEKYRTTLQIGIKKTDIEILEYFNSDIGSEYSIVESKSYKNNTYSEICSLHISNQEFTNNLINQGVTSEKSKTIKFPSTISDNLMCHYIRGLIDGDGGWHYVNNKKGIGLSFCSSVKSFVEEFQSFLSSKLGISKLKIITKTKNNSCFSIKYCKQSDILKLYHYLYNNKGPFLKRKHKRVALHLQNKNLIEKTNEYDNDDTPYHPGAIKIG